jgi:hypothetical protein
LWRVACGAEGTPQQIDLNGGVGEKLRFHDSGTPVVLCVKIDMMTFRL